MTKGRFFRPPQHLYLPPWTGPFVACGDPPETDAMACNATDESTDVGRDDMQEDPVDAFIRASMSHLDSAAVADAEDGAPRRRAPSPYFLQQLQATRHGDAVSGGTWSDVHGMTSRAAKAMGHLDRTQYALATVASLLHASQQCVRRRPEDFGIGDDRHEGLIHAIRELVDAQRVHLDALEIRAGG